MTAALLEGCADPGMRPAGPVGTPSPSEAGTPSPSPSEEDTPVNLVPAGYHGRFRISATVLESREHGPQLCRAVFTSDPPQCWGPDVVGWSWDAVQHESKNGTTWGGYLLVGTFDGTRFTMTEPAQPPAPYKATPPRVHTTPCPVPAGGWRPVDAAKTTDDTLQRVFGVAASLPDYAGLWIDQLPPSGEGGRWVAELTVVNVRFTRDLSRHKAELRKVWGGPLCVTPARHSEAELKAIQDEWTKRLRGASTIDVYANRLDLQVWVAYAVLQEELDARYGLGVVRLVGSLEPLD
jgi:hypothetical protein